MRRKDAKSVVITGMTPRTALATAKTFANRNAPFHIGDVDKNAVAAGLAKDTRPSESVCDIGSAEDATKSIAETSKANGGVYVLINNVGICGPSGPAEEIDFDGSADTLRVILGDPFFCIRKIFKLMKSFAAGAILNISTTSATAALPHRFSYEASKTGLQVLTRALARDVGPCDIRCNAPLSGLIDNPRGRRLLEKVAKKCGETVAKAKAQFLKYVSSAAGYNWEKTGLSLGFWRRTMHFM